MHFLVVENKMWKMYKFGMTDLDPALRGRPEGSEENPPQIPLLNETDERGGNRVLAACRILAIVSASSTVGAVFTISSYRVAESLLGTTTGVVPLIVGGGGVMLLGSMGMVLGAEAATMIIQRFSRTPNLPVS